MADPPKPPEADRWSHLHAEEQQRLAQGNFSREELDALTRGEDPWPKPVQQSPLPDKSESDELRPFNEPDAEEGLGMAQPTAAPPSLTAATRSKC